MSKAKYYKEGVSIFPHKFDDTFPRAEFVNIILSKHPEYSDFNAALKYEDL